jgi:hypothetical protein
LASQQTLVKTSGNKLYFETLENLCLYVHRISRSIYNKINISIIFEKDKKGILDIYIYGIGRMILYDTQNFGGMAELRYLSIEKCNAFTMKIMSF